MSWTIGSLLSTHLLAQFPQITGNHYSFIKHFGSGIWTNFLAVSLRKGLQMFFDVNSLKYFKSLVHRLAKSPKCVLLFVNWTFRIILGWISFNNKYSNKWGILFPFLIYWWLWKTFKWKTNFRRQTTEVEINISFLESIPYRQHDFIKTSRNNIDLQSSLYENVNF